MERQEPVTIEGPCPKCGSTDGWSAPKYCLLYTDTRFAGVSEYLQFTCLRCGYWRSAPTLDAAKAKLVDVTHIRSVEDTPKKKWWQLCCVGTGGRI